MLTTYRFESTWELPGTADAAWTAIVDDARDYPVWWPDIASAEVLEPGDDTGLGRRIRFVIRSQFGYRLAIEIRLTELRRPTVVAADVVGELTGHGRWELTPAGDGVRVHQLWEVTTTRWWMRVLAPVARPVFWLSHERAAARGEKGLAEWLVMTR